MSDLVPHKRTLRHGGRLRWFNTDPERILFHPADATTIQFTDGELKVATCLGCHDVPCIEMTEAELSIGGALTSFPGNPSKGCMPDRSDQLG